MAKTTTARVDPRERRAALQEEIQRAVNSGDTSADVRALNAELRNVEQECADLDLEAAVQESANKVACRVKVKAICDAFHAEREALYDVDAVEAGKRLAAALRATHDALGEIEALRRRDLELNAKFRNAVAQLGGREAGYDYPHLVHIERHTRIASRLLGALNEFFRTTQHARWFGKGGPLTLRDLWEQS